MLLEQVGPAGCRSYLVGCERARRVVWIDPLAGDLEDVLARLDAQGLTLDLVVDTHTHADHVSGGRDVAARTGVPYALHESTECTGADELLRDGARLDVGDVTVDVVHTPGHTPDSVTLRTGRHLFTGDFLFLAQDGAGRTDLPGGDPAAHWDSLRRLAEYDDDHVVHPGHDYLGSADTGPCTLGGERVRNPRLTDLTREEYVAWQRAIAMPTPRWMLDVIARNLGTATAHEAHHDSGPLGGCSPDATAAGGGACAAGPMDAVPLVDVHEARRRMESDAPPFLLDVREPWEFAGPGGRHAPGAVLVPLGTLPASLGRLPADPASEVLVICKSGGRSASAAAWLIAQGRRRVFNVQGGTDGWVRAGLPVA